MTPGVSILAQCQNYAWTKELSKDKKETYA